MAKFKVIEILGREKLLRYLKSKEVEGGKECPTCHGWGKIFVGQDKDKRVECPECGGTGKIKVKESTTAGSLSAAPAGATPMQRYDAKGQPTSAVMPKGFKKKKKKKIIKRVLPK
jgi:DnaJ-class molecular chaperone